MAIIARSVVSKGVNSFETGLDLARRIRDEFGNEPLASIVLYSTVNHDQSALVRAVREIAGPNVALIGCSTQGVVGRGSVMEQGYAAGAMGLGGSSVRVTTALSEGINVDSKAKGVALGRMLRERAGEALKAVIVHYDPLCAADVDAFLGGLHTEVGCPIVGGAASEFWGPMLQTFQYFGDGVHRGAAVAMGLSGNFTSEIDLCHGTSPIGIEMEVTEADGNCVLRFDDRPALDVWTEFCSEYPEDITHSGAIGVGLPTSDPDTYLVRCAFGVVPERSAVVFQGSIPAGTRVLFHHRTVQGVLEGTAAMGRKLAARLEGKKIRAVLGFECGARTQPFLGKDMTLKENVALQEAIGQDAAWLGSLAWGEVSIFDGRPGYVNFSYPLLVLAE